jgi:putative transcriptional regulator
MNDLELLQIILGDIAANENYGLVMKKWRELFNITQSRIAKELQIKQSVISDYENNRRKSPGIEFIRKYTQSLINIGKKERKKEYETIIEDLGLKKEVNKLFAGEFKTKIGSKEVINLLNGTQILAQPSQSSFQNYLFFSDKITNIVTKQPSYKLLKDLKSKKETVYIFSHVRTGKVPLILLKMMSKLNRLEMPKLIIFQSKGFKLSSFARKIAKNNNISIAVTREEKENIKKLLNVDVNNTVNN